MVKLRLKRMGKKFNAFYRIVAADARAPRDGRFIEEIGYFNPHSKELKIEKDLAMKWLSNGAVPTDTVRRLFKEENIMEEFHNAKNGITAKPKKKVAKLSKAKSEVATKDETKSESEEVKKDDK